ncbi:ESP1 [Candida pseudojiufengensis]|uniref:ESP1 n=1 Tax=Candida pseudojiufengensis TaxID=497109 RepID=UPI0022247FB5|nr:ESP1 [Candida pseudojiufengensis]KAI5966335.1 ESP1 [Candida pseudojiufengensis]
MDSLDQTLLTYVQQQNLKPLSPSKNLNLPKYDIKTLESSCITSLNESLNKIEINNLQSIHIKLQFLYSIYSKNFTYWLGVLKKHQLFIVRLFELKQIDVISDQLVSSYSQICYSLNIECQTIDKKTLIQGIPYKACDEQLGQIIIAFHFYTLQWLVQNLIKQEIDIELLKLVPSLFLSTGNLRQWIFKNDGNKNKYTNNCIKLLNAFIKITEKLGIGYELEVSCLKIKLMEITGNSEKIEEITVLAGVEPFLNDSKSIENIHILSRKLLDTTPQQKVTNRRSSDFTITFNNKSIINKDFLINLSKMELTDASTSGILKFFIGSKNSIKQLSSLHLEILDSITKYFSQHLEKDSFHSLEKLYEIFNHFKLEKKLKNLSTLLLQLGKKTNNEIILDLSVTRECEIVRQWPNDDNLERLISKLNTLNHIDSKLFLTVLQSCPAKKAVIGCIYKLCLKFPNLLPCFNQLEEHSKISYVLGLLTYKDVSVKRHQKTIFYNSIMSIVKDVNNTRVILAYYNVNNIDHDAEISILEPNFLIASGLELYKMLGSSNWNQDILLRCVNVLQQCTKFHNETEHVMARQIILGLKYNGMTSELYHLINTLRENEFNDPFKLFLEFEMCHCSYRLSLHSDWNQCLDNIHALMKNAKSLSLQNVLDYKLQRIAYLCKIESYDLAIQKFQELTSVVKSRPEFDMSASKSLPLVDKMKNYIILAKLQILASHLNSNDLVLSFSNIKNAIQSLQSIIHNCPNITKKFDNDDIVWECCHLLFEAYDLAIEKLIDLGLSKNIYAFLKEWKKLNETHQIPIVNQINSYKIRIYASLLNTNKISETIVVECDQVSENKTVQYMKQLLESTQTKDIPHFYQFDSENIVESHYEIKKYKFLQFFTVPIHDEIVKLELSLKKCTKELSSFATTVTFPNSVQVFPSVTSGEIVLDQNTMNNFVKLGKIKDQLLKMSQSSKMSIIQRRKYYYLLSKTLHIIASISAYKGKDLIYQLFFIQDLVKFEPFQNNRALSSINKIGHIPELSIDHTNDYLKIYSTFKDQLNNQLPSNWKIITIDICEETGDILLSKFDNTPTLLRLSLSRFEERESIKVSNFEELKLKFKTIFANNRKSTQYSTTSLVKTSEDRKEWWRKRFNLNYELQELCEHVENYWFGGFKSIFSTLNDENDYQLFRSELIQILQANLSVKINSTIALNELVYKCFYGLEQYDRALVDDLLNYLFELLQFHLEINKTFSMEKIHQALQELYEKYPNLRTDDNSHIILIPSSRCSFFPWESLNCLRNKSVSRMPSISMLLETLKNPTKTIASNVYYLVNPGGDLQSSESRFRPFMETQKNWKGIIGSKPKEVEIVSNILNSDLFIYIGHGGCEQYIKISDLIKATKNQSLPPSFLIGCSSGEIQDNGKFEPSGLVLSWLNCKSSAILVNLWDVTDKDIDAFTISMFEKWGLFPKNNQENNEHLANSIRKSRDVCVLKYLNGAAPIIYGIPISLNH